MVVAPCNSMGDLNSPKTLGMVPGYSYVAGTCCCCCWVVFNDCCVQQVAQEQSSERGAADLPVPFTCTSLAASVDGTFNVHKEVWEDSRHHGMQQQWPGWLVLSLHTRAAAVRLLRIPQ